MLRHAQAREELFRIVTENAADMIALVDMKGRRLYNSPSYKRILGYSPEELGETSAFEQIHPDDRYRVLEAAREARKTGLGKSLQYRIRHKNGEWRVFESTASTIRNEKGEVAKLVIVNRDITERKRAEEQLEQNSFHDALTGLPNRRLFLDRLQRCFLRGQHNPDFRYAVIFVDIDDFKVINEKIGSARGDQIVGEIAARLLSSLQPDATSDFSAKVGGSDVLISRLGGDEFTVLLEPVQDPSDAMRTANRILAAIAQPFLVEGGTTSASASIGIGLSTTPHNRPDDLLQQAETAMHRARALGGSRCELFDVSMHSRALNRLKLETDLQNALNHHQLQVYYQPILRLEARQIVGFEALLRWRHPEQGVIAPDKFIEAAEDLGLLNSIGRWVLDNACRQISEWQSRYPSGRARYITVNLSSKQFAHAALVSETKEALQRARIDPGSLQLEIAEHVAIADPEFAQHVFFQLRQAGIRSSIDDFGADHSSLSWLRRFPIDGLKIDRRLINAMPSDRASCDVVQLITMIADHLHLEAVAEGVEAKVHLDLLLKLGCKFGQGYLFAQPLAPDHVESLLRKEVVKAEGHGAG